MQFIPKCGHPDLALMCHTSKFWSDSLDCLICSSDSLREQDPTFLCSSTQEAVLEILMADFKASWLSEIEEIQFLGAQRVPSLDLFSTEEVFGGGAMEWVSWAGKKTSVNFSGVGENSVASKNCFTFGEPSKSDITSLIFQRCFLSPLCSPLGLWKFLHSSWNADDTKLYPFCLTRIYFLFPVKSMAKFLSPVMKTSLRFWCFQRHFHLGIF